mgnify:CR=1 FL=1
MAEPDPRREIERDPFVSIVIGNYNQGAFAEEAIRSVAAQTYAKLECVVVDDKSSDDSVARIEAILADLGDDRFRLIASERNDGFMANTLKGLDATTAPLIAFLDADDAYMPDFVERHVKAHASRREAAAVSTSDLVLIDGNGKIISGGSPLFRAWKEERPQDARMILATEEAEGDRRIFLRRSMPRNWLWSTNSGFMFRRSALVAMRPLSSEKLRIGADGYWVQVAHLLGGTVRIDRALGYYRLHDSNIWATNPFLGNGSTPGFTSEQLRNDTVAEMRDAFIERLPQLATFIQKDYLIETLIEFVGRREAVRLWESDAAYRSVLTDFARPGRRRAIKLSGYLPRKWQPRKYR